MHLLTYYCHFFSHDLRPATSSGNNDRILRWNAEGHQRRSLRQRSVLRSFAAGECSEKSAGQRRRGSSQEPEQRCSLSREQGRLLPTLPTPKVNIIIFKSLKFIHCSYFHHLFYKAWVRTRRENEKRKEHRCASVFSRPSGGWPFLKGCRWSRNCWSVKERRHYLK